MKSVKTVAIGVSIMLLSGCFQRTDAFDIKVAEQYCKGQNSNVKHISVWFDGDSVVRCTNEESAVMSQFLDEYKNKLIDNMNKEGQDEIKNH